MNGVLSFVVCMVVLAFAAHAESLLLVLSKGDHTLAMVDPATFQVKAKVDSGPDPHEVVASADGKFAYISNYTQGNTLTPVDLIAGKALAPIGIGALLRPHGLEWFEDKLYFTAEGSKVVARYDPASAKVDWLLGTGQNQTHMVIASKDGKLIFTSNIASATVCVIERAMGNGGPGGPPPGPGGPPPGPPPGGPRPVRMDWNITTIPVGRGAEGFDLSPDGKELWAANAQDATVSVIDVAAKKVTTTIPVSFGRANRLKFTPDGKQVLISDLSGNDLYVLDAASRSVIKKIGLGGGAAGIQMEPNGKRAFVSVGRKNSVAVIDLATLAVVSTIDAGREPDGLAWAKAK